MCSGAVAQWRLIRGSRHHQLHDRPPPRMLGVRDGRDPAADSWVQRSRLERYPAPADQDLPCLLVSPQYGLPG